MVKKRDYSDALAFIKVVLPLKRWQTPCVFYAVRVRFRPSRQAPQLKRVV